MDRYGLDHVPLPAVLLPDVETYNGLKIIKESDLEQPFLAIVARTNPWTFTFNVSEVPRIVGPRYHVTPERVFFEAYSLILVESMSTLFDRFTMLKAGDCLIAITYLPFP